MSAWCRKISISQKPLTEAECKTGRRRMRGIELLYFGLEGSPFHTRADRHGVYGPTYFLDSLVNIATHQF